MRDAGNIRKRLGDFEIVRELGRGGMGIVYEARQISLNRKVALKVLSSSLGMTTKAVIRFRREAETAAKLHHTNIVPVHATGEEDGTHFYAMELVDGPSLNFVIRNMRDQSRSVQPGAQAPRTPPSVSDSTLAVSPKPAIPAAALEDTAGALPDWVAQTMNMEAGSDSSASGASVGESSSTICAGHTYFDNIARMIADVADALGYAHDQGVIHRDMKPSNLLLSPDGRVSINDFGLARMLEQPGMTTTGEFMGSPLYMSPEQITAGRAPLNHRTDIYSLGATLYELLTLQPPFLGERRDQVIGQIMHKEPRSPRSINKKIPVDLETICLKAMEKDPDRRYQTGEQFSKDLRRFVNRFAISAKRAGVVGRTTKWIRRHPAVAVLLALIVVTGSVAGLFAYNAYLADLQVAQMYLEQAKENALLYAMSGEFDRSEEEIERAEEAGGSTSWVRVLRGQVALYQSHNEEAVRHAEQAVKLEPDNTAAYGLLVEAVGAAGNEDRKLSLVEHLIQMKADGFQDYLLKGMGESMWYPVLALQDLDQAINIRPSSSVARLIRASVRNGRSMSTGRIEDNDLALADSNAAMSFLPDNPLALRTHLTVSLVRAHLFKLAERPRASEEALRIAGEDANRLVAYPGDTNARWGRAYYLEAVEDYGGARDALCGKGLELKDDQPELASFCANVWFNDRNYDEALAAYDKARGRPKAIIWFVLAYIRMEMEPDHDKLLADVVALHREASTGSSGVYLIMDWTVFRLLGETKHAANVAQRWKPVPGEEQEQWAAIKDYMTGTAGIDETVSACSSSAGAQSFAHYIIAMDSLGKGNRSLAAHHFQMCRDEYGMDSYSYWWSRTFLARLKDDPTWPPWISMREDDGAKNKTEPASVNGSSG